MTPHRHPDWYATVRRHWRRTSGFLLARREPCITLREQELAAVKGRILVRRDLDDWLQWTPNGSWILGVLLCPGDDIHELVRWCRRHKVEPSRVWFFLHPDVDTKTLLPWEDARYETDQVDIITTWKELHKLFGLALNDRVYADWKHLMVQRRKEK